MSQQDKTTLQSNINSQLADNTTGDISAADVRNNLINITDSLVFNNGDQAITGSLIAESFTGSLQGTATTASYVAGANVDGQVPLSDASYAVYMGGYGSNADLPILLTISNQDGFGELLFDSNPNTFTYNPNTNRLKLTGSISVTGGITGSLQGTATTASYVAGANVDGVVAGATNAINSALVVRYFAT
jgi:hypothetical protein